MFGVLLLHTFGSTNLEFKELVEQLHSQGFQTNSPNLPGHGVDSRLLRKVTYNDWIKTAENALSELNCQGNFIIGQGSGAAIALILAASHPELLGIITLSGIVMRPRWKKILSSITSIKGSMIPYANPESKLLNYNPKIWRNLNIHKSVPLKSLNEVFGLLRKSRKLLKSIYQPILVYHSTAASDVSMINAQVIFNNVSSPKKKLMQIDEGGAIMSVDEGKNIVFRDITNFLWGSIDLYQM